MSDWKSLADVMQDRTPPTKAQVVLIDMILLVIDDWLAGELTLEQAIHEAGDGWLRSQVFRKIPFGCDASLRMKTFLSAITATEYARIGAIPTKHGLVTVDLLAETAARIVPGVHPTTGDRTSKIQFPVLYPKDGSGPIYPAPRPPEPVSNEETTLSPHMADWFTVDPDELDG